VLLEGKRLLVTGVLTRQSIAFSIARRALEEGASVTLTSFGRTWRMTERSARQLGLDGEILEFDALDDAAGERLAEQVESRGLRIDGAVHAIAFAPPGAIGGNFVEIGPADAEMTFRASAYSLNALARGIRPGVDRDAGAAMVALDFDASVTWPAYNWMGVAKASLESVGRYLARNLSTDGIRVNLVSAGPVHTVAASAFDRFNELIGAWERFAPLGWDGHDPLPVANAACYLLSDLSRGTTGNIIRVDGGMHLLGGGIPVDPDSL
jgi:enoyl ACP reductase